MDKQNCFSKLKGERKPKASPLWGLGDMAGHKLCHVPGQRKAPEEFQPGFSGQTMPSSKRDNYADNTKNSGRPLSEMDLTIS